MKKKILLLSTLLFSFSVFSHADLSVYLKDAVKSEAYYTFPDAEVYEGSSTDRAYGIRISFARAFSAGDKIDITLPHGWSEYPKSTPISRLIKLPDGGVTAAEVESFLQDVQFYLAPDKSGNDVMVVLLQDESHISDMNRQVYFSLVNNKWYEYVDGRKEWWDAYNLARNLSFLGAEGCLATLPFDGSWIIGQFEGDEENSFLHSISSGKKGWLGGTRADLGNIINSDGILSRAPTAELNYWYWACGSAFDDYQDPEDAIFYNKKKVGDTENPETNLRYDYNAFGPGKPDNAGSGERYLYMGYGDGKQWDDTNTSNVVNGYFVEYNNVPVNPGEGFIGYSSKKRASIDGVYNNGTETNPAQVVFGDEILYEIDAVNSPIFMNSPSGYVVDTIPLGLTVVGGSISHGGEVHTDEDTGKEFIKWELEVPVRGKETVSFKATPALGVTNDIMNYALANFESIPALRSNPGNDPYEGRWTDTTWHRVAFCTVTFASGNGGSIGGGPNPQTVDYSQHPDQNPGITLTPDDADYKFVGWSYPAYTSLKGENKPAAKGIMDYKTIAVYGDMDLTANWSFRFDPDTVTNCEPPLKLESGHDGLSYEWILPDGSKQTTADIQAQASGTYYLHTNYGSITTVDSIVVLFAFDANMKIEDLSPAGTKIGRPQIYTVAVDTILKDVTYQWSFSGGGDPATSTADTATVVYKSTGSKTVTVTVTVKMPGSDQLECSKTLTMDVMIYDENRNFFVDQNVMGGRQDGSSWVNAYRRVEDALDKATSGDCIWVAKGVYSPPANSAYMLSHDSVEVYGGFGAWETSLRDRKYGENLTILRGSGTSVIINTKADSVSCWDGFIIEGGKAEKGGGIFNDQSSVTIANCVIRSNEAVEGGGIYTLQGNPLLYNLEISGNTAQLGGAMYTESGNPRLINLTISGNRATDNGGGLYNNNANPAIFNSIIWGNKSNGNAVMVNSASTPYFTYTLIERYGDDTPWNTSFGIDGGNNIGGGPLFKRNGFDDKGNMRVGDYRLGVSSTCVNTGLNRYLEGVRVRGLTNLEDLTETVFLPRIPYDVQGNERIEFDRVDRGAYEYASNDAMPIITRRVYLPDVEGLLLDKGPGEHYVESQNNFVFTIAAKPGYNLDDLTVKTDDEQRDEEGLEIVWNEDGTVTVTLIKVMETILVTINDNTPSLSSEVGNNDIDNGQKVWSYMNNLHINTDKRGEIQIYTIMGQLVLQRIVDAGETVIQLRQGMYLVQMNGQIYKIVIKM